MTITTTKARVVSALEAIPAVGLVHLEPQTSVEQTDAEADLLTGSGSNRTVNAWEIHPSPRVVWDGCGGVRRTELAVRIVALWGVNEAGSARDAFVEAVATVCSALMDTTTGFPQIDEGGVRSTVSDRPVKTRTGHAAWRAELSFNLIDVSTT